MNNISIRRRYNMPCRVGITTDPDTRKLFWQNQVVGLKNWKILETFKSKEEAQGYETRYARRNNCQAHAGGADAPGTWYVYRFDYTRSV
jgi:hypothetical protein